MIQRTQELLDSLSGEQANMMRELYATISQNLPDGYEEKCDGKMIHWVVPLSTFPQGYHCTPGQALGMVSLGPAKEGVTLHHMGLYFQPDRIAEFRAAVEEETGSKADLGKACLRMKKPAKVAPNAIGALMRNSSLEDYLSVYQAALSSRGKG